MDTRIDRRRMLGFIGASGALGIFPLQALHGQVAVNERLRTLVWDRERAEVNWRRKGGPLWVVNDDTPMLWGGARRDEALSPSLPPDVRGKLVAALVAASQYYLSRGLPAPHLPLDASGAFNIFYVAMNSAINGGTGPHAGPPIEGSGVLGFFQDRTVPAGTHIVMSGGNLLSADYPEQGLVTLAHELGHAIDATIPATSTWPSDEGKHILWLGEGSTHAIANFALRRIGFDPVPSWRSGVWHVGKEVGRRPYDVPLSLTPLPKRRPDWVIARRPADKDNPEADLNNTFWTSNATYLTCSFWRFLFQEEAPVKTGSTGRGPAPTRPGDFELFAAFRNTPVTDEDVAKAEASNGRIDAGVLMLDRFLRTHPHPVWGATGLYRAFPAFIAHIIEWPDQIGKTRQGFFAHDRWLESLFMDGVELHPIEIGQDIITQLKAIAPLSARAIRFILPVEDTGLFRRYPKVTITITVHDGPRDAIDHIHVGVNGNVLANHLSQTLKYNKGRVRRWVNVDAGPLFASRTNGESVLSIINAAPDPKDGRPLKVWVHVAMQVADANGQCSYHPLPTTGPQGQIIPLPASVSPPTGKRAPTIAVERGSQETEITIVQDADLVKFFGAVSDINPAGLSVQRDTDAPPRQQGIDQLGQAAIQAARPTTKSKLIITLYLPRTEPGQTGAISGARVGAEWFDPVYAPYEKYGITQSVTIETDKVAVNITSNTEGSIVGRFVADFDRSSDNAERIFRGRIEGGFSIGIASDEDQGEGDLPNDGSALMPTDFFIAAARAGFDGATIAAMIDAAAAERGDAPEQGGTFGGDASTPGGDILRDFDVPQCPERTRAELRRALDQYLRQLREITPGITPDQLRTMREAMLADPAATAMILCNAGL